MFSMASLLFNLTLEIAFRYKYVKIKISYTSNGMCVIIKYYCLYNVIIFYKWQNRKDSFIIKGRFIW